MMHVSADLKKRVQVRIDECVAAIEKQYNMKMPSMVVEYDINSSRLAGQACYPNRVRLNPVFLNAYGDEFIADTVGHEVAHIAVFTIYYKGRGRRVSPHGYEWASVMATIGQDASRCHNFDVPAGISVGKQKAKYNYKCTGCGAIITAGPKVHAKIQAGHEYWHSSCPRGGRNKLEYVAAAGRVSYSEAKRIGATMPTTPVAPTKPVVQPKVAAPVVPRVAVAFPDLTKYVTKADKCTAIYMHYKSINEPNMRRMCIETFVKRVGMTAAGASTYYSNIQKKVGA